MNIRVFGDIQQNAVEQMKKLVQYGDVAGAVLTADHHQGYSQPIGGVVAYRNQISVSGVGADIACGNKAAKTDLTLRDVYSRKEELADLLATNLDFGVGRVNNDPQDHELFDSPAWDVLTEVADKKTRDSLRDRAYNQLGTIGSSNHYLDVFVETEPLGESSRVHGAHDDSPIWIGAHFGSRGLGYNVANGFLKLSSGDPWDTKGGVYDKEEPTILDLDSELGQAYWQLMELCGQYAYAGRDYVVSKVATLLGARELVSVHNHHNFGWRETHNGEELIVVRKGSTPMWPGQQSFIGGSMTDISVIVEGIDSQQSVDTLRSTVHGAGRIMGRREAAGKVHRKTGEVLRPGKVTPEMMREAISKSGISLRGGGLDESPFVYRKLDEVLAHHSDTQKVLHRLRPLIVCMAPSGTNDPGRD